MHGSVILPHSTGACVTSVSAGDMCPLNSDAVECNHLQASRCECRQGYRSRDPLTCDGKDTANRVKIKSKLLDFSPIPDIDECEENWPCSAVANCTNTPGSFSCQCNEGYIGDGFSCTGEEQSGAHQMISFHSLIFQMWMSVQGFLLRVV